MHLWSKNLFVSALAGAILLIPAAVVRADGWGMIKGQVVLSGDVPKPVAVNIDKDQAACMKNGPIFKEDLTVNPKNKGVKWAIVYLMSADGFDKDIPIHPNLKAIKKKVVEIDQPCCKFEPHLLALRQGQTLLVKNSAGIAHNVNIAGGLKGPNLNQIVPAGGKFKLEDIAARPIPMIVKCDIHAWMKAQIAVLKHPYFAVTDDDGKFEIKDAPAGTYRLVIWQESMGWVIGDKAPSKKGKEITIKDGGTTDLGKVPLTPSKD
jgi:hypothetical protein